MEPTMFGSRYGNEVLRPVVEHVLIQMMDDLVTSKLPPLTLLDDVAMFTDLLSVDGDVAVVILDPALACPSSAVTLEVGTRLPSVV